MSKTLRLFATKRLGIEPAAAWYLNDLGELRGKQELYTRQSPQRLRVLRQSTRSAACEAAKSGRRVGAAEPTHPASQDQGALSMRYSGLLAWPPISGFSMNY